MIVVLTIVNIWTCYIFFFLESHKVKTKSFYHLLLLCVNFYDLSMDKIV